MIVYMINAEDLKKRTTINANVDNSLLFNAIREAQDIYIQGTLGTRLYDKLIDLIRLNTIGNPENAKYKRLLDEHVMYPLIYWSWCNAIPYIRFKIYNTSVAGQSTDTTAPATTDEVKELSQPIKDKAEFYTQRLADHLKVHHADYPEYCDNLHCDEMKPNRQPYFCGIVLDQYRYDDEI